MVSNNINIRINGEIPENLLRKIRCRDVGLSEKDIETRIKELKKGLKNVNTPIPS